MWHFALAVSWAGLGPLLLISGLACLAGSVDERLQRETSQLRTCLVTGLLCWTSGVQEFFELIRPTFSVYSIDFDRYLFVRFNGSSEQSICYLSSFRVFLIMLVVIIRMRIFALTVSRSWPVWKLESNFTTNHPKKLAVFFNKKFCVKYPAQLIH